MLDTLLLEDSMGQKLVIMEFFLEQPAGVYPINTICSRLALSHGTAGSLLAEINHDLQCLSGYTFLGRERKVLWQPEKYRHNCYIQYLIRTTIPYKFVLQSLVNPEERFATFCDKLFLSESTVLRKLRPLKRLLKRFSLCLVAAKMHITGPELTLRMFYSTYLWLGSHGADLRHATDSPGRRSCTHANLKSLLPSIYASKRNFFAFRSATSALRTRSLFRKLRLSRFTSRLL